MPFSTKPWSSFSESDYSLEQWHRACLIHLHEGAPTSKDECKLPVREPSGTYNRSGIHAAASVLAGGRGGVNAPAADKRRAARSVRRLYGEMGDQLPESVRRLAM